MENQIQQPQSELLIVSKELMQIIYNHFALTPHILAEISGITNRIMQETSEENQKKIR